MACVYRLVPWVVSLLVLFVAAAVAAASAAAFALALSLAAFQWELEWIDSEIDHELVWVPMLSNPILKRIEMDGRVLEPAAVAALFVYTWVYSSFLDILSLYSREFCSREVDRIMEQVKCP